MSLVFLAYHDENISDIEKYGSIRDGIINSAKDDWTYYKSKYNRNKPVHKEHIMDLKDGTKLLTSSNIFKHRTMGEAATSLLPPRCFLRKHEGIKWRREPEHVCPEVEHSPPVPKHDAPFKRSQPKFDPKSIPSIDPIRKHCPHKHFLRNHQHRANFIKLNIEKCKRAKTCYPEARYVDTVHGDTKRLVKSGMVPQYVFNKNFGKVPIYLRKHQHMLCVKKKECAKEQEEFEQYCLSFVQAKVRPMTEEERTEIVQGLKANLAELTKRFLFLPLYVDTPAKIIRKSKLEKELRQLENDLVLIENNKEIFVSDA